MKVVFRKSFERDLKKIKDRTVLAKIRQSIEDIEAAVSSKDLRGVKKLGSAGRFYRIRVGEYRIGLVVEASEVEFVRCLHRREDLSLFPMRLTNVLISFPLVDK